MDISLLKYHDTTLDVCFRDLTRRQMYDMLRAIYVYPTRIRVCPCIKDPWIRQVLTFLNAHINNEPSHRSDGLGEN
jgi:hypothetical protein